jgi:pimeloyl-ACP methyl ester carboxylesterase
VTGGIEDLWFSSPDGLRLHALAAGSQTRNRLPVICLPGLARTAEDFRELLVALASHPEVPRRAIALDSRGRGMSAYDSNPANYSVPVEVTDLLSVLAAAEIDRAIFVGTSRGGILTMALAATQPQRIAGAVLNDIGPVIEMNGLLRIKSYVGRMPAPKDFREAIKLSRSIMEEHFPALDDAKWELYARRTWREDASGGLVIRYDPALANTLASVDATQPLPALWPQFHALAQAPVMVMRGEHSDILSRETVDTMRVSRPDLVAIEVTGQGHAPLLIGSEAIDPIVEFVSTIDR